MCIRDSGYITIFDGKSLDGWRGYGKDKVPSRWIIEDGCLKFCGTGTGEGQTGEGGDLIFAHKFKNFELELEWKISKGGNSGIFYLAQEVTSKDKDGNEVMAFDGEQSATIQNGLLVLQESRMVGDSYDVDYDSYGTCSVIDLATGKNLPVPEGAYSCIVCGDMLVFTCYARPADLAENEWDDDSNLHSWVAIQQKDGTQTYGSASSTAYRISVSYTHLTLPTN